MQQFDWLHSGISTNENNLSIRLIANFIAVQDADTLLKHLLKTTPWQQPRVRVYGKWHPTPRMVAFYADPFLSYRCSETLHGAQSWTPELSKIRVRIEQQLASRFNAVLLDYYRDGRDTMGWHADDEKELGYQPVIASLSLGAARDIYFKAKSGRQTPVKINLASGSLLIMDGQTQAHWLHHIPKRLKCNSARINLTFRNIFT